MCQDSIKKVPKVKGESKRDERMRDLKSPFSRPCNNFISAGML